MRHIILLLLTCLTAIAQPYTIDVGGTTRRSQRAALLTVNSNIVWEQSSFQTRFNIYPIYANSNFTITPIQASSMSMSNYVFTVDTTASNITLTMPTYFANTFSVLNLGTNWVTMQSAEGNKFLTAPMDGSINYSDTLVNKYALKVHTLFHINTTNVVVQSEFRPLPNAVFVVTNNITWPAGGEGSAQTNISYSAVTNAPWQWASANLTNWSGVALFDTNGVNAALIAADVVVSNGLSARLIATNDALVTKITNATNGLYAVVQPLDSDLTSWAAIAPSTKEGAITAGTTAQYWRGDKSWQTLDKTAVALGSVDNVADASKPVSTAQLAAIVSATNNIDAAKVTVGNLSVSRLNSGTSASSSTYWRGDGTWATPSGGGSGYRTKLEMTTNFVNAHAVANTLTNIPQLSFAVTSGTTYKFQAVIYFTTAATTTGSRWTLTGPAMTACGINSEYTLTATTTTRNAMLQATNLPAACNLTSAAGVNMATITGILRPSASGTVAVAFASEVLSSAVTAQIGSTLEWW